MLPFTSFLFRLGTVVLLSVALDAKIAAQSVREIPVKLVAAPDASGILEANVRLGGGDTLVALIPEKDLNSDVIHRAIALASAVAKLRLESPPKALNDKSIFRLGKGRELRQLPRRVVERNESILRQISAANREVSPGLGSVRQTVVKITQVERSKTRPSSRS